MSMLCYYDILPLNLMFLLRVVCFFFCFLYCCTQISFANAALLCSLRVSTCPMCSILFFFFILRSFTLLFPAYATQIRGELPMSTQGLRSPVQFLFLLLLLLLATGCCSRAAHSFLVVAATAPSTNSSSPFM